MFTGIVSHQAQILDRQGGLFVMEKRETDEIYLGQSIAHDGACMSVVEYDDQSYSFFAMNESLEKTTLARKSIGSLINIEYCLRMGDRLDGHIVTGHIDTQGIVSACDKTSDGSCKLMIAYPSQFSHLLVSKGSIAINGVSLTVVDDMYDEGQCFFSVWLIPLTLSITNMGGCMVGDSVNLEFDMLAKYAHKR